MKESSLEAAVRRAGTLVEEVNEALARLFNESWRPELDADDRISNAWLLLHPRDVYDLRLWFRYMGINNWQPETHRLNGIIVIPCRDMPRGKFRIDEAIPAVPARPLIANYHLPSRGETMRANYHLPLTEEPMLRVPSSEPIVTRYDVVKKIAGWAFFYGAIGMIAALVVHQAIR